LPKYIHLYTRDVSKILNIIYLYLLYIFSNIFRLLKQYRKIFVVNNHVAHFLFNDWDFRNQKLLSLSNEIPLGNQQDFGFVADVNYNGDKLLYYK